MPRHATAVCAPVVTRGSARVHKGTDREPRTDVEPTLAKQPKPKPWSPEELFRLQAAVNARPQLSWLQVAEAVRTRSENCCRHTWRRLHSNVHVGRDGKAKPMRRPAKRRVRKQTPAKPEAELEEISWFEGVSADADLSKLMDVEIASPLVSGIDTPFRLDDLDAFDYADPDPLEANETLPTDAEAEAEPTPKPHPVGAFKVSIRASSEGEPKRDAAVGPILKMALSIHMTDLNCRPSISYSYQDLWGSAATECAQASKAKPNPTPNPNPAPMLKASKITDFWKQRRGVSKRQVPRTKPANLQKDLAQTPTCSAPPLGMTGGQAEAEAAARVAPWSLPRTYKVSSGAR